MCSIQGGPGGPGYCISASGATSRGEEMYSGLEAECTIVAIAMTYEVWLNEASADHEWPSWAVVLTRMRVG